MKKSSNKHLYIFIGLFLVIIFGLFFILNNKTFAEGRFYFEEDNPPVNGIPIPGRVPVFFNDLETCMGSLKDVPSNLNPTLCKEVSDEVIGVSGVNNGTGDSLNYKLLAPIGNTTEIKTNDIGKYFNILFNMAIGIAGVLAVVMIVIGGIQWMGSESIFGKTEGKEKVTSAILGLLIAVGSYALLNTINPDLLGKKGLYINQVAVFVGDVNAPVTINLANMKTLGIKCDQKSGYSSIPAIANSFNNKMTYSQVIPKGQLGVGGKTIQLDCSGFVDTVLKCSGVNITELGINGGTINIFGIPDAEKVTSSEQITSDSINGKTLKIGDLVGWTPQDDDNGNGHVMIYIGNGRVADSHGPTGVVGKALGEFSLMKWKTRITYVVRTQSLKPLKSQK